MMHARLASILALLAIVSSQAGLAQYPNKPVTILVGFDGGSVGDQMARGLAEAALKHFPQAFVVVNRPGASGTLAMSEALRAQPDGYTVGLGTVGILTIQPHLTALQYGGPDTYVPVAKLVNQPNMLTVRTGAPWKTAREFLEYARARPGHVTVGVPGLATVAHLNLEQLKRIANVDLKVEIFNGPQQVQAALLGKIDAAIAGPGPIMPHVHSGKALAIGVFDERRLQVSNHVPTFKELGFDVTLGTFQAVVAPRGTPAPIVQALANAIQKAVTEPSFITLVNQTGNSIDYKGPDSFATELRQSFEKNGELVKALGLSK